MTYALLLTLVAPVALGADCKLPPFQAAPEHKTCKKDDDCGLASDWCRHCTTPIPVNNVYLNDYTILDLQKRLQSKCIKECKPCTHEVVELRCIDSVCTARRVPVKAAAKKPDAGTEAAKPAEPKPQPAKPAEPPK